MNMTAGMKGTKSPNRLLVPTREPDVEALREVFAREVIAAFGLDAERGGMLRIPALATRRLAYQAAAYDEVVGERGLRAGGGWALERMVRRVRFRGEDNVPREGPLLVVSNHPGLSDTVALFAGIPRDDLRVVAARRPFLDALPNTARYLLTVEKNSGRRLGLVRAAVRHMKSGGAVLTFPGGGIEPDPAVLPGAADSLKGWSVSLNLFARLVPGLTVVPAVVSGVLSRRALLNPLTLLRSREEDRRRLAATLQMLTPRLHGVSVSVDFGCPLRIGTSEEMAGEVVQEARLLMERSREK